MGLIMLPGCRYWYADYYVKGKRVRVSTRTGNKHDARKFLEKLLVERDEGAPQTDRFMTYADLRAGLIQNYKEKGNKSLHLRANGDETVNGLSQLDDFFGYRADNPGVYSGPYVREINTETGRQFANERKRQGAGNAVINRSLACLRRMLKLACEEKRLAAVPIIRFLKEPPARTGVVEEERFNELLAMLPTHLRPLVCFLYWTGVRGGEALSIQWDQVDLQRGLIVLKEGETKNDEARTIPLASQVVAFLLEAEPKTGHVFDKTNLRKEWQKACVAVDLGTFTPVEGKPYDPKYRGLNVHDLRRSALTELTRSGAPTHVSMKISGHKDPSVFQRYNIVNTDDIQGAMRMRERLSLGSIGSVKRSVKSLK